MSNNEFDQSWKNWIESRNELAGDFLVKHYMPLVHYHVQRIAITLPKNVSKDDLKSFGLVGLFDALEKFDPTRDLKFDTYASFRIRGTILDGLRKEDWLPRSSREKAKRIERVVEELEQKLLRNATVEEIAKEVGMSEEEVYVSSNEYFFASILSLDENPKDDDDGEQFQHSLKDIKQLSPEDELVRRQLFSDLESAIHQLSPNEQLVVSLFYKEELTLTEIGHTLGLSTSRISQIHSKAIFKMRKILETAIHKK